MTVSAVVYEPAPLSGQSVPKASGGWFWNRAAVVCCPPCDGVLPLQGSVAVNSGYIMLTATMAFGALEHPVDVLDGRRAPAGAPALRRSEIHRVQNEVLCDGCISLSNGEALLQSCYSPTRLKTRENGAFVVAVLRKMQKKQGLSEIRIDKLEFVSQNHQQCSGSNQDTPYH